MVALKTKIIHEMSNLLSLYSADNLQTKLCPKFFKIFQLKIQEWINKLKGENWLEPRDVFVLFRTFQQGMPTKPNGNWTFRLTV